MKYRLNISQETKNTLEWLYAVITNRLYCRKGVYDGLRNGR